MAPDRLAHVNPVVVAGSSSGVPLAGSVTWASRSARWGAPRRVLPSLLIQKGPHMQTLPYETARATAGQHIIPIYTSEHSAPFYVRERHTTCVVRIQKRTVCATPELISLEVKRGACGRGFL